jgi:fatty-acyl-CoA synthase
LLNAPAEEKQSLPHVVEFFTAAAPPPEAVLAAMKAAGFNVTHLYGLTETYGPAAVNEWQRAWDALSGAEQAAKKARQGVRYVPLDALDVRDPETMLPVARDEESTGEVMLRGNVVMKGYLKNKSATASVFAGGWFHPAISASCIPTATSSSRIVPRTLSSGREHFLDRGQDASVSIPLVVAAVVANPTTMGRDAVRLVELAGHTVTTDDLIAWCRKNLRATNVRATWCSRSCRRLQPQDLPAARDGEGGLIAGFQCEQRCTPERGGRSEPSDAVGWGLLDPD